MPQSPGCIPATLLNDSERLLLALDLAQGTQPYRNGLRGDFKLRR